MEYIKHLPFYLVRWHGSSMMREFSLRVQAVIIAITFHKEVQCTILEEDMGIREAQKAHKSMAWFTFDPSVRFGENNNESLDLVDSKRNNEDENNLNIEQRSEFSTFQLAWQGQLENLIVGYHIYQLTMTKYQHQHKEQHEHTMQE